MMQAGGGVSNIAKFFLDISSLRVARVLIFATYSMDACGITRVQLKMIWIRVVLMYMKNYIFLLSSLPLFYLILLLKKHTSVNLFQDQSVFGVCSRQTKMYMSWP